QCDEGGKPAGVAEVDASFEALLAPAKRGCFDFWVQRLERELGKPDNRHALALVGAAARDPNGVTSHVLKAALVAHVADPDPRDEQYRYLIRVLENDGYLVKDGERYRFRSELLRQFWVRHVLDD